MTAQHVVSEDEQNAIKQAEAQYAGLLHVLRQMKGEIHVCVDCAQDDKVHDWSLPCDHKPDWNQMVLGVSRRSPWVPYNNKRGEYNRPIDAGTDEFQILLAWGGPGVQIIAETGHGDEYPKIGEARLEYSCWDRPWTEWKGADRALLREISNSILGFGPGVKFTQ